MGQFIATWPAMRQVGMPPWYPAQGGIFLFDRYFPNNVQTICKNDDMISEMW